MKIRAKANGNVLEMSEDEARPLLECGLFEELEEEGGNGGENGGEDEGGAEEPKKAKKAKKK